MKRTLILPLSLLLALVAAPLSRAQDASATAEKEPAAAVGSNSERDALNEKLALLLQDIEANGPTFDTLDQIGDVYLRGGDIQRASIVFQKAIADFGGTEELFIKFSRAMAMAGRPENSVEILSMGLEELPDSETILFELSKAYLGINKPYAAVSNLKKVLALDPSKETYRFHLAEAYRLQKKLSEASGIIDALLEEGTQLLEVHLMKGNLLLAQGEEADGVRFFEDLLEERPDSESVKNVLVSAYQYLAYKEAEAGRLDSAVLSMRSALEVDPANSATQLGLAVFLNQFGEHEESETTFKNLLEQSPNLLDTYVLYGRMLEDLDRTPEAATIYQRGLAKSRELEVDDAIDTFRQLLGIPIPK